MPKRSITTKFLDKTLKKCKAKPVENIEPNLEKTFSNIKLLQTPIKSESDKKEYRVIQLENALTALLISDNSPLSSDSDSSSECETDTSESESETSSESSTGSAHNEAYDDSRPEHKPRTNKLAAAALSIGVGSYSDPNKIQGLAHFLEHMVFMGSEAYPKENDFDSFIKQKGGSDNAHTDCENTTFHLEIRETYLQEALHRFAQFFISPLMQKDAMTREREAVESEFQSASQNDSNRLEQLLMSFAREGHPARIFTWGNMKSLKEQTNDEYLYEQLHAFRKRHYSANRMTLAVQARLPLDVLEQYVVRNFSGIPNNNLSPLDFKNFSDKTTFDTDAFKRIYWVKPVKDIFEVNLTWSMPSLLHLYRSKPHVYISSILGHEGKGSLLAYLRRKLWGLTIETGNSESGSEHNSMFALFSVCLVLTREGMKNIEQVLNAVFSYLSLLRREAPNEQVYNELKLLEDTDFRFQQESQPSDNVEEISVSMQYYPPKHYLTGSELYFEYNPQAITDVLNNLIPETVNITILDSSLNDNVYAEVEPWFNTKYMSKEIPKLWKQTWQNIPPLPEFSLPEPNQFLTTDFSLITLPNTVPPYPGKIFSNEVAELWHKLDSKFRLPLANMYYYLITPFAQLSPKHAAMLDLYVSLLQYMLVEQLYPATAAALKCAIYSSTKGIVIKTEGFNEKLPLVLTAILKAMKDFSVNLKSELFLTLREQQLKNCHNFFIKPTNLIKDLRACALLQTHWSALDKYIAISEITLEDILNFAKGFQSSFYIQNIVQGNMTEDIAKETLNNVMNCLNLEKQNPGMKYKVRVVQLPIGENFCCTYSLNKSDINSVITNYYQGGLANIKDSSIIELLMMMMEEPIFDNLRTKEQLGYDVYCQLRDTWGVLGFTITVQCQADKFTTSYVNNRIEQFIVDFKKILNKMKSNEYNDIKQSLIKLKQCADVDLREEVTRNWAEITSEDYLFDRLSREIDCIKQITLNDITKWFNDHTKGGENFRKISFQVMGHVPTKESQKGIDLTKTKDITEPMLVTVDDHEVTTELLENKVRYSFSLEEKIPGLETKELDENFFITNLVEFKNNLFVWPIKKTALSK